MSEPLKRVGPWQVTEQTSVYNNPWIEVVDHKVVHPDGSPGQYGVVRFKSRGVGVLPIDSDGMVRMVGQHRFPLDTYSWEVPEGGCPTGEDLLATAKRELGEETGLSANHWLPLFSGVALSNSVCDERGWGFIAWELSEGESHPEPSEDLMIERWPFRLLLERVLSGEVSDSVTQLLVLTAQAKAIRGELPDAVSKHIL